jgi:NTP pyrophosphatase (non-canonical NTP hydrolase)
LDFYEYQERSRRTVNKVLSEKELILNMSLGLAGETGEVVDLIKKQMFHGHDTNLDKLKEEVGDVLFYIVNLCSAYGLSVEEIAIGNVEKLLKRYPNGFSKEDSIRRVDVNE